MLSNNEDWDWRFGTKTSYWSSGVKELWSYRHLLISLVKRDFILNYKQTILGPIWILIQPILTLITYVLVFGKLVGISTGGIPKVLFYFSGIVLWNFFSDCFGGTSNTFRENSHIFSKVYFPRIIMPIAVTSTQFLRFLVQLFLLLLLIAYYWLFRSLPVKFNLMFFSFPFIILLVGGMGLGWGLIFSVLSAKYRDMLNLVGLGLRLMMFATPVIYPLISVPEEARWVVQINPLTPLFEMFRLGLLGEGVVSVGSLVYAILFTLITLVSALLLFNKQGDKLIDLV